MFSKNSVIIITMVFLITINIIVLSVADEPYTSSWPGKIVIAMVSPFQEITTRSIRFSKNIWRHYFSLISVCRENDRLKNALKAAIEKNKDKVEVDLTNARLRSLLNFKKTINQEVLACEVISKDPSAVIKTVIINKGGSDGLTNGVPVVVSEGIVGRIIEVSNHYSKVLLVIDANSAVDALVQRTRARGIVKGALYGSCRLDYVLWRDDVQVDDVVISSGLDGVYPKGLRLGKVSGIVKHNSGVFQEVNVHPFVDFEKLEEVLVILNPPGHDEFAD